MNRISSRKPKRRPPLQLKDEKQEELRDRMLGLPPGPHLQKLLDNLRKQNQEQE
jgi:hypothetical protein